MLVFEIMRSGGQWYNRAKVESTVRYGEGQETNVTELLSVVATSRARKKEKAVVSDVGAVVSPLLHNGQNGSLSLVQGLTQNIGLLDIGSDVLWPLSGPIVLNKQKEN